MTRHKSAGYGVCVVPWHSDRLTGGQLNMMCVCCCCRLADVAPADSIGLTAYQRRAAAMVDCRKSCIIGRAVSPSASGIQLVFWIKPVVRVIWHEAALLPYYTDCLVVFTRWHHYALVSSTRFSGPTHVCPPSAVSIRSAVVAQLTSMPKLSVNLFGVVSWTVDLPW